LESIYQSWIFESFSKEKTILGARKAEDLDHDSPSVNEHLAFRTRLLDAASTLSSVAATTDKIRIGTSILNTVTRNPVIFAKTLSSIDIPSS
jgi:alkanesulfonate monooxygenase SsuD/methylene tetrahydromethanopterin reductase-like flavin-dependent oxidoreductase (luciferase family)